MTGSVAGGGGTVNRQVSATFLKGGSPFQYAFAAEGKIRFSGGHTDSYDSGSNPNPSTFGMEGHVRTNKIGDKSIELSGSAYIGGDAWVGPGGQTNNISTSGGSYVAGSKLVASSPIDLPPISMPSGGTPFNFPDANQTISAGTYAVNSEFKLSGGKTATINGNVTLYLNKKLTLSGGSEILISSGSSLTVFSNDEFNASGGSVINNTQLPANFQVYGTRNCDKVSLSGSSALRGAVYAPNAALTVTGSASIFGAAVAKTITMSGQAFHYDKALKNLSTQFGTTSVKASGWKEKI